MASPLSARLPTALAAAALSLLFTAAPARALTVLNTFGPGDTATGDTWSLYNGATAGQSLAVPFSLAAASTISDILTSIDGNGAFTLGIVAGAGLPSGAMLYSVLLTDPVANVQLSNLGWSLAAGDYWLVGKGSAGAAGTWQGGNVPSGSEWAFTNPTADADWLFTGPGDAPAARIDTVSAVPEPSTWGLMVGGVALLGWQMRRRSGGRSAA